MRNQSRQTYDPEADHARIISAAYGLPFVDLEEYAVSCGLLRRIDAELACRLRCVPMIHNTQRIVLVVDEPFQALYLSANPELIGPSEIRSRLEFALTTRRGLDRALERRLTLVREA